MNPKSHVFTDSNNIENGMCLWCWYDNLDSGLSDVTKPTVDWMSGMCCSVDRGPRFQKLGGEGLE